MLAGVAALAGSSGRAVALSLRPAAVTRALRSLAARVALIVRVGIGAAAAAGKSRGARILKPALAARLPDRRSPAQDHGPAPRAQAL